MAEAVVNGSTMSRFFCHKCNVVIECLLPDYTCPGCECGFIEELENETSEGSLGRIITNLNSRAGYLDVHNFENDAANTSNRNNTSSRRARVYWARNTPDSHQSSSSRGMQEISIEDFLQELIRNLTGAVANQPTTQRGQRSVLFLGNPGDYAWGRNGLDTIVTRLLNQIDGAAGPPPLPRKQIDEIPTTSVSQAQVDCKLQCSVCWEYFKAEEAVRQLPCQHIYHAPCIVPWLELHATCPICRQSLGDQNSSEAIQDTVRPSLGALLRAASESNTNRTSSSSSSSDGNWSNI